MNPFTKMIENNDGSVSLTREDTQQILASFEELSQQLNSYKQLFAVQQQRIKKATRIYKISKALPENVFPDIAELIDWLLERSGRRKAVEYREAMRKAYAKLDELGDIDFDAMYQVKGEYILSLRTLLEPAE